ncbi:MAG: helix-turn-helix domain-containing protein [Burkholderiaceae bacterium]|nr:helix-turn-helix domain-containing protein [Burkholderiaceae bacterium]
MTQRFTTSSVPPGERLAYWTDMICDVYVQLDCDAAERSGFRGSIRSHRLAQLDLSVVDSVAQRVLRTPRQISRAAEDYFLVSIQTRGRGVVSQDGRDALLQPGDFALYDSTRPYELGFGGRFEQIVLMLPGSQLRSMVRGTERLTATAVNGRQGAGNLMISMLRTLQRDIAGLQPASASAVANGIVDILVAGLHTLPAANRQGVSDLTGYHLARIKRLVAQRLPDPLLSVATVAAELQLSVGHVHRLFQNEPVPLAHYIWNQRLDACHRDLRDPALAGRGIAEIAFSHGFNDAAHFSRSFRRRFGVSAREHRAGGRAGRRA